MANVTVSLTGDEARLLKSLDKVIAKERELAAAATGAGQAADRAGRQTEKAWQPIPASLLAGVSVLALMRQHVQDVARVSEQATGRIRTLGESMRSAAAIARSPAEMAQFREQVQRLRSGGLPMEAAARAAQAAIESGDLGRADLFGNLERVGVSSEAVVGLQRRLRAAGRAATPEALADLVLSVSGPGATPDQVMKGMQSLAGRVGRRTGLDELAAMAAVGGGEANPNRLRTFLRQNAGALEEAMGRARAGGGLSRALANLQVSPLGDVESASIRKAAEDLREERGVQGFGILAEDIEREHGRLARESFIGRIPILGQASAGLATRAASFARTTLGDEAFVRQQATNTNLSEKLLQQIAETLEHIEMLQQLPRDKAPGLLPPSSKSIPRADD